MSSVTSKYLQVFNAKQFIESVSEPQPSNVYITFGRSWAWANDSYPPQANTSAVSQSEIWRNMIGGKKFTAKDIRHVVPRFDWTYGNKYSEYDDLIDTNTLKNANTPFYVLTEDNNVYKCISNNYGAVSTFKPTTLSSTQDQTLLDGYIWKYMYTLNPEEILKFSTNEFIPVRTLTGDDGSFQWQVQKNAIDGDIHNIHVTNHGIGYVSNNISVIINGDGQGANAFAVRDMANNNIAKIVIDNRGFNYRYANVSIVSEKGSGAKARAVMSPFGGHGANPLIELGGSHLLINMRFNNKDNGLKLLTDTEYRQIAIIEDPIIYGSSNVTGALTFSQVTQMILSGATANYMPDEYVYQGPGFSRATFKGIVSSWDSSNNVIKLTNVSGTPTGDALIGHESFAIGYPSSPSGSPVIVPDLQPFTGNILYINNIKPIARDDEQSEVFKIILSF